ncbi:unnamed protein product [Adineta steineri]|uniref:G-protein coupled receptors family 1 profile domain-containing protein n=1 Tax=Adineta steineri TaxID=433720 RepID=A0A813WKB2_9BILA|nr:unnamed protein product [Adineta steineri]CAF4152607.1 unnamed protein product [Adineta steineri]
MNTSSDNISNILLVVPYQLNIWFGSFLWITGNIGCIGSMIVFRSEKFLLLTRILQKDFQISLINHYIIICKLRQFSTLWGNVVSFSLFSFAIIDRFLSTHRSYTYRQWSNRIYIAYKMIIIIPLIWFLLIGHRIIFYNIQNGLCGPLEGFYEYYDNYFQVIFSSICPAVIMSILAYFLIKNVHNITRRKTLPINNISSCINRNNPIINQIDKQLTIMLISESLITIITYIPYAIELTYLNISQTWYKTPLQLAWEKIFTELIDLISYIFSATSFYVSIISNNGFRRTIKQILCIKKNILI